MSLHDRDGLGVRVLRIAFVYGDDDPHLAESLMWAREWAAHKRLHMVHHADVAQALIRGLRGEGIDGQAFNVADDAPVNALELHQLNGERPAADAAQRALDDPWVRVVRAFDAQLTAGLSERDLSTLRRLLGRLRANVATPAKDVSATART